jgi:L-iditol 2-dehydrogenase
VTDISENRLNFARDLGAAFTINVAEVEDQVNAVKELTEDKRGVDVVIEVVGLPEVWGKTIHMARKGGKVLLFGGTKSGSFITIDTELLHYSQLTIKGVFHTTPKHVEIAFELIKNKVITADKFVTNKYKLEEIEKALLEHREGKVIKNCIVFDD